MQQTILIGQTVPVAQPVDVGATTKRVVLSTVGKIVKNCKVWWNQESRTFTDLCATEKGETFTHGEVVLTHLGVIALIAACGVAEWLEGGAV